VGGFSLAQRETYRQVKKRGTSRKKTGLPEIASKGPQWTIGFIDSLEKYFPDGGRMYSADGTSHSLPRPDSDTPRFIHIRFRLRKEKSCMVQDRGDVLGSGSPGDALDHKDNTVLDPPGRKKARNQEVCTWEKE
jgi:hypothetical protein